MADKISGSGEGAVAGTLPARTGRIQSGCGKPREAAASVTKILVATEILPFASLNCI
jgi:hypothetical protein